jgi:hypothetical protein
MMPMVTQIFEHLRAASSRGGAAISSAARDRPVARSAREPDVTPCPIGKTGLNAAPLMLGGNVFGWTADYKQSFAILDAFVETGGSLIDTADIYCAPCTGLCRRRNRN